MPRPRSGASSTADGRRLLPLLTSRGFDAATRVKAAAALVAPGIAARRLERIEGRTGASQLRRPLEPDDGVELAGNGCSGSGLRLVSRHR